jgi:heme-degrading monooxygenase HmoA
MFASTPDPPYTAVIFTSRRTAADDDGYARLAERMDELASRQPGFLGIESARDPGSRLGITVSYWASEADAAAWKQVAEHLEAQHLGATRWYERYQVRIASVTRAYPLPEDGSSTSR